jgi:aubergine-like protein
MSSTYDRYFSKYFTEEITSESAADASRQLLGLCLKNFFTQTKVYPTIIILYRSGTNQYEKIKFVEEIKAMDKLISGEENFEAMKKPFFIYISVNKKVDTKFFENNNERLSNPQPGTVIDTNVVSPDAYEFYIQPQFVNSGTATPTHFQVLHDTSHFTLEEIEEITNYQCYYYWNWPGPIREPAVLKMADKANEFTSKNLKKSAIDELKLTPYFI